MKKLIYMTFLLAGICYGQVSNPSIIAVSSAPSGSCTNGLPIQMVFSTGALYSCQSGTWAAISGGGGGMVYPGAGVANSTGSAWATSYSVNGAGAGLTTGPAISTSGDVTTFTGAAGQIADSSILLSSLAPLTSVVQLNPATTAANTIAPTSTTVVPLTVNCPTGISVDCLDVEFNGIKALYLTSFGNQIFVPGTVANAGTMTFQSGGNLVASVNKNAKVSDFDVLSGWTGTATAGTVVAVGTTTHSVVACAVSCTNAFAVVDSNPATNAYIQTIGSHSVNLDGTYTVTAQEYVCASATTGGEGTPQLTSCPAGEQWGYVTTPATSVTTATIFLQFK